MKKRRRALASLVVGAILAVGAAGSTSLRAELRVPAYTAYSEPEPEAVRISPRHGITEWNERDTKILWFGDFKHPGEVHCSLVMRLPEGGESKLKLTVAGTSREFVAQAANTNAAIDAGTFTLAAPGYYSLTLQSLNPPGRPPGDIEALILDGPAAADAHFNLKTRRNAASVHLFYPTKELTNITAFYCEVTALEDPLWTFYMACGWHRGYFGMQVNSPNERRIIFSVWDSGDEAVDRSKVATENRVQLVAKGDGVEAGDFGNEGTGGHSHLIFPWRTGEKQRFLVTARPADSTHTIFSGYFFEPDKHRWNLISSWRAPKEGGSMRGLHSFSENFGGANGQLRRKALYGNQWARTADGQWHELTAATFSHDGTGKAERLDRFMGVEAGQFFLSHGGFIPGTTPYGELFNRPGTGSAPNDLPVE